MSGESEPRSVSEDDLTNQISALREWPLVSKGNYPSWDGGFASAQLNAASQRLALAVRWMESKMPCTTGQCCHELRQMIAACREPSDE